jgi:mannosyltransferase
MNWRQWLPIASVLALAAVVRFHGIGDQPLWLDEGYSWWDARQSLADLWHLVPQCDPHPPLYFLLLKAWVSVFGDKTEALRALSALLGVSTTLVMVLAGRSISPLVGVVAGLMFALTPFQIEFAREARPYALLCFGAAMLLYGAMRVATCRGDGRRGWWLSGAGVLIALWSNNTSVLMVASACAVFVALYLLDRTGRLSLRAFAVATVAVAVLWLPYLPTLIEQAQGVSSDFWIQRPEPAWRIVNELRFVVSLSVFEAFWPGVLLATGGLWLLWRRQGGRIGLVVAVLAVLPVLLNYLVSMTVKPIFLARTLIGVAPAMILAGACAVTLIRWRGLRNVALAVLVGTHLAALWHLAGRDQGKEPWDRIALQVSAGGGSPRPARLLAGNAPIVLVAANELALPLSHALKELHLEVPLKGAPADFPAPGLGARYPSGKCAPAVRAQDLNNLARVVRDRKTVWFITRRNNVYDPDNGIAKFLARQGLAQVEVRRFMPGFLEVYKFVRQPNPLLFKGRALSMGGRSEPGPPRPPLTPNAVKPALDLTGGSRAGY